METNGQLVQTYTTDDLLLNGFFVDGDKGKPAVIHIHGFEGDLFSNGFVHTIGDALADIGNAYLTVQTRGMGKSTELYTSKEGAGRSIGGDYELLSEAHYDISAWIKFLLDLGYKSVILQGHSLGTIKVVRYLTEGSYIDKVKALILLCPFDKTAFIEDYTNGKWKKYVKIAKEKIAAGNGRELVPPEFDIAETSYQSYVSWYEDTELSRMFDFYNKGYRFPILRNIKVPVHVVVGSKDEYFSPADEGKFGETLHFLLSKLKNGSGDLIDGATHSFKSYGDKVAECVKNFVASLKTI